MTYPPGVTTGMIPGWTREDVAWDRFWSGNEPFEVFSTYYERDAKDIDEVEDAYNNDLDFQYYLIDAYESGPDPRYYPGD